MLNLTYRHLPTVYAALQQLCGKVDLIINGQIASECYNDLAAEHGSDALLAPEAIAESYYYLQLVRRLNSRA